MTKNRFIALEKESMHEYPLEVIDNKSFLYADKKQDIQIETNEFGITFITLGDKTYPIEITNRNQNEYEVLINGIAYSFSLESPFSLERLKKLTKEKNQSTTIRLKAPMPGTILEVLVETGDIVKAGDTLLILEAMKMQNAILSSTKGVIKKVLVKDGDSTSKSDLLIEMEREV